MATRRLSFQYVLKQNKNDESTAFGKWFAEAYSPSNTLSLKGLCERVAMNQSLFTPEIARGVIDKLTTDMAELLQSATSVKWDGLGTFRPTVESQGAIDADSYDINTMVKGIHIRFIPVNDKGEELTSRKFAESLVFVQYGKKTATKVTKPSGKPGYTGDIVPTQTSAMGRSLPVLEKVDDAAPTSPIALKTTGSTLKFSGSKAGVAYHLKRGASLATATELGTATSSADGDAITINSGAQSADASSKSLWVVWNYKGKDHNILCGQSTIVSA